MILSYASEPETTMSFFIGLTALFLSLDAARLHCRDEQAFKRRCQKIDGWLVNVKAPIPL